MSERALWQCSAVELSRGLKDRSIFASHILRSCLDRIQLINDDVNAFVALNPEAENCAKESDRRWQEGRPLSAIDGIPVAIKDNLVVAGMPCTWGSWVYKDYLPDHDELPIEKLKSLGAIPIGKTNLSEFAMEGFSANELHGVTRNPWDLSLTPGGSSGGSVASVCSGMVPLALGTDGGGSIRRPAGFTGTVGLKPSIGRVERGNGLPQLLLDFEVVGPIARSVADCRLLFDAMTETKPEADQSNLRILFVETLSGAPLDPEIRAGVNEVARRFEQLGHDIEKGALPFEIRNMSEQWSKIGQYELARLALEKPEIADKVSPTIKAMVEAGKALPADTMEVIQDAVKALRRQVRSSFKDFDVLLTPTSAAMPWTASEPYPGTIDGKPVGPRGHAIYTGWVNASGLPAISLPAGKSTNGLPIGFQLISASGRESFLFDIAESYENGFLNDVEWPL